MRRPQEVLSSPEAGAALDLEELLPYRHDAMALEEALLVGDGPVNADDDSAAVERHQVVEHLAPTLALAESVLGATAAGLVRAFRDGAGGGGGRGGTGDVRVSKRTWQACVAEAGRRRLSVVETLGGRGTGEAVGGGGGGSEGDVERATGGAGVGGGEDEEGDEM